MREIKYINSHEEAESLIGARVESWTDGFRDTSDCANGVITSVHRLILDRGQGVAQFTLDGKYALAQVSPHHGWTLRVVQEPPGAVEKPAKGETPAERVARLRNELEDAERELDRGLPEGWARREGDDTEWTYPNPDCDQRDPCIGFDIEQNVYLASIELTGVQCVTRIHWTDLTAWVDYIRENDLAPE